MIEAMQLTLFDDPAPSGIVRSASLSECGLFRWWLGRDWGPGPIILWVMLNPSVADADIDDPTLLRVMAFSRAWGYGGVRVVNLHPFRSPHPSALREWLARDEGVMEARTGNLSAIRAMAACTDAALVAWGAGALPGEEVEPLRILKAQGLAVHCIGITMSGAPKHPLARGRSRVPEGTASRAYVTP